MEISDLEKEFEDARKFWEYIEKRRELLIKVWSGDQWKGSDADSAVVFFQKTASENTAEQKTVRVTSTAEETDDTKI